MSKKKKSMSTLSFANLTGGKRRGQLSKKKVKKAAKFHLQEMKISKKEFAKIYDGCDSGKGMKRAQRKYRREHADQLADILLNGKLKNPEKYEDKIQEYLENGKLFNSEKKSELRKVAKNNPALFAYSHMIDSFDADTIKAIMKKKVRKLTKVTDEKTAVQLAPLAPKSNAPRVLRTMVKFATDKDPKNFDAKDFFDAIKPKMVTKREWKAIIVQNTLGLRGGSNNAIKDIVRYSVELLADMPKDTMKKILKRYADNIQRVSQGGEKLNFVVTLKDLTDKPRIERLLDKNPNLATKIGQV